MRAVRMITSSKRPKPDRNSNRAGMTGAMATATAMTGVTGVTGTASVAGDTYTRVARVVGEVI